MSSFEVVLQLLFSIFGLLLLLLFMFGFIKKSSFGVVVFFANSWLLLGLYICPILFVFGFEPLAGNVYMKPLLSYGVAASLHCLLLAVGMVVGGGMSVGRIPGLIIKKLDNLLSFKVERSLAATIMVCGLFAYALFLWLVGVDIALVNAAASRGGDFEGFGEGKEYLFLKTLGLGSLLGGALLLYFLINKKRFFVALYLVVVIISYLNSISRTLLLAALITPLITYLVFRVREKAVSWGRFWLVLGCTGAFGIVVVQYGKIFGHFLTSVFDPASNAYDLIAEGETSNIFNYFLSNYTFMWSSVDSGIDSFFKEGPFFTVEPIYALFFGWIPSGILKIFGLGWLYYGDLPDGLRMSCVNGSAFLDGGCTVPPLMPGYSAYWFPFVGALVFGIFVGYFSKLMSCVWIHYEKISSSRVWVPYFLFSSFLNLFTFIPSTIGYTAFMLILVILGTMVLSVLEKIKR